MSRVECPRCNHETNYEGQGRDASGGFVSIYRCINPECPRKEIRLD